MTPEQKAEAQRLVRSGVFPSVGLRRVLHQNTPYDRNATPRGPLGKLWSTFWFAVLLFVPSLFAGVLLTGDGSGGGALISMTLWLTGVAAHQPLVWSRMRLSRGGRWIVWLSAFVGGILVYFSLEFGAAVLFASGLIAFTFHLGVAANYVAILTAFVLSTGLLRRRQKLLPLAAAYAALREIERNDEIPGLRFMKREILKLLADRERTTASLVDGRLHPKALIYLLASNVAYSDLCTGRYHIYRGVLSSLGREILSAFVISSERMIADGLHDRSKHDEDLADLRKEIASIG